jgi:hypothetical protein
VTERDAARRAGDLPDGRSARNRAKPRRSKYFCFP